jgi:hypothetical protein
VYIYNWLFISIINVYICASNLRWPELFGQGPRAVRQGRSNCEVGVARVAPRVLNEGSQRTCMERSSCARCIFSFLVLRSTFTFLIAYNIIIIYIYKFSSRLFGVNVDGARRVWLGQPLGQ